jgi:hypothetical protein
LTAVGPAVQVRHELFVFRQGKQPKRLIRTTRDHEFFALGWPELTTEFPGEGRPSLSIDSRLGLTYERRKVHTSLTHFTTTQYKSTIFYHFGKIEQTFSTQKHTKSILRLQVRQVNSEHQFTTQKKDSTLVFQPRTRFVERLSILGVMN